MSIQNYPLDPRTWRTPEILLEILPVLFHKLKNKLTPILGYAQILKAVLAEPGHAGRLEKIEAAALDLTERMNLLREHYTLPKPPPQPGDLAAVTTAVLQMWDPLLQSEGITVHRDGLGDSVAINLFEQEIRILLCELLDNSITAIRKRNRPGGAITVTLAKQNRKYILTVRDDGVGMSESERDQALNPFYSTKPEGAGLGLVICEKIAKNHEGALRIESAADEFCEVISEFPI